MPNFLAQFHKKCSGIDSCYPHAGAFYLPSQEDEATNSTSYTSVELLTRYTATASLELPLSTTSEKIRNKFLTLTIVTIGELISYHYRYVSSLRLGQFLRWHSCKG